MENRVVVIDDQQQEWKKIVDSISKLDLKCYPLLDQFKEFRKSIEDIIIAQITGEEFAKKVSELFQKIDINPILFIVDISLDGKVDNTLGLQLGRNLKNVFESIPIIYVTRFTQNAIGKNINDDEIVIYKPNLFVELGEKILELLPELDANQNIEKAEVDKNLTVQKPSSKSILDDYTRKINQVDAQLAVRRSVLELLRKERQLFRLKTPYHWIDETVEAIFILLICASILFLLYFALLHAFVTAYMDKNSHEISPFKFIEYLFISPLPLIITFTFYNYYKRILQPILFGKTDEYIDDKKISSMLDINISKYLFISILFSTLLVTMLEFASKGTKIITTAEKISQSEHIKNLSDTTFLSSIKNVRIKDISNSDEYYFQSNNIYLVGFITAGFLVIFLVFYLFRLEKHISKPKKEA